MVTVKEICVLVKYSPKRENFLQEIQQNIEDTFEETEMEYQAYTPVTFNPAS